jgi:acetyl-CoA carboxylase / biotin carboxylase 1
LKFGSFIVDALVNFKQPCIVYIPPKAELRGGAWVVVDSRINPHYMDMFADPDCRAGVLEPTGIVEIKFRDTGLASLAERLDPVLKQITHKDQQLAVDGVALDDSRRTLLKESRDKRLQDIIPIYKQVKFLLIWLILLM